MVEKHLLNKMLDMVKRGGEIALSLIDDSAPSVKPDQSILTRADLEISAFIRHSLQPEIATTKHLLIDEEDKNLAHYFDQAILESFPYVWVVDPIDGTRSFANKMPMFGVSIGLLKDLQPWMGAVYFPMLHELFYCDGRDSYFVKSAFTGQAAAVRIRPVDQEITVQSIFFGSDDYFKDYEWDERFCTVMLSNSAVVDLCWPAVGRGCGSFFNSNIWDFAGSWPICQSAGLKMRSFTTGKLLDRIETGLFIGQGDMTWRCKDFYILSSERNYPLIKGQIRPKR
ncbi:MAG: inositol monophosphatase family protein [Candidatus Omnitrophota bacterium]|nr:inositol monophosphatase family protein [Candidatus Omnitrophota bacterium]MDZ4242024.1 inositol monophosphatase family protein [Candidatus Omnitrophota bacterium]